MSYLFPYWMVKEHSRVGIYGFGDVGKNFFLQLKMMRYADCVLVTDKEFNDFEECVAPFAVPSKLKEINLDYLVIAVLDKKTAEEIKREIVTRFGDNIAEDKIVWSPYYNTSFFNWSQDRKQYLKNPLFFEEITRKYLTVANANWEFARCKFYQSFLAIGIDGIRNSQERIGIYHLYDILKKNDNVLDIGCNCGFLDLQIAPMVGHLTGMDIDPNFIDIANMTAEYVKADNTSFICSNYADTEIDEKFDVVFSLAVHSNIVISGLGEDDYVRKIFNNVANNGYFFFESHEWSNDADRYRRLSKKFEKCGFVFVFSADYVSDFERRITVFRKKVR